MRSSMGLSNALIHCASNGVCKAIENSSVASIVSGVEGSNLRRRRSASSLKNAVRGAKPKSASSAVKSTVCSNCAHQACTLLRMSGLASIVSSNKPRRAMAPSTEFCLPRIQAATSMIHRLRSAKGASGSRLASRAGSRLLFALPNINAEPAPDPGHRLAQGTAWHPAQSGGWGSQTAGHLR